MITSEERLLLLNIVRLHFEDKPYFVSVESITTSNSLSVSTTPSAEYSNSPSGDTTKNFQSNGKNLQLLTKTVSDSFSKNLSLSMSPTVSYNNSPTISYTPLQGDKFTH